MAGLVLPGRAYRLPLATFGLVWAAAVTFLSVRGEWAWVRAAFGEALALAVFVVLTIWVTRLRGDGSDRSQGASGAGAAASEATVAASNPFEAAPNGTATPPEPGERAFNAGAAPPDVPPETHPPRLRSRLALQLGATLLVAILAVLRFHEVPLWAPFVSFLYDLANAAPVPRPNYLVNPILFAVLPLALVLALGARPRELGFRRGWRSWTVSALWTAPVVVVWIVALADGAATVGRIGRALLSNLFQNGFGEEVLWRGIIQTRLARLWTPEWGLVLAALGFGWWHIDSIHDWAGQDLWLAAALNVTVQAPMGLALGVIFQRTRNLLAPTVVHTVANSVAV